MKRFAQSDLCGWYKSTARKPLVIRGARQVGKSTLVRLAAKDLGVPLYEINLEKHVKLDAVFAALDARLALREIETLLSTAIDPKSPGILFLDEIQATPHGLSLLRYFYEDLPALAVVAAGSLLEFALTNAKLTVPVGRIEYLYLGPATFGEFLIGKQEERLQNMLIEYKPGSVFSATAHEKCLNLLRDYLLVGGMPEAVVRSLETDSTIAAGSIQAEIVETFRDDFGKYAGKDDLEKLRRVYEYVPMAVGKKFKYVNVNPRWKAADIRQALTLLVQAGIVHLVRHADGNGVPLGAESRDEVFKPLFLDVGLMNSVCGVRAIDQETMQTAKLVNEGALAEQFIGQHLMYAQGSRIRPSIFYWLREGSNANAEVDYLVSSNSSVIPIEVKAGAEGSLKSLHLFMATKTKSTVAVRFDGKMPTVTTVAQSVVVAGGAIARVEYTLCSLPLYMVEQMPRLIKDLLSREIPKP
jgi:uncharacterized protein